MRKIGMRIETLRLKKGLTRAQLGKLLNMSLSKIWNIENGYAALQWSQICRLASFFNETYVTILCDEENSEPSNREELIILKSKVEHYEQLIQQLEAQIMVVKVRLGLDQFG